MNEENKQPKHQLHQPFKEESGGKTIHWNWEETLGLRRVDIHGDHLGKLLQSFFLQTLKILQRVYQEEKVELLEKYLTWFTPLVSSIAAIIFAAEEEIDKRRPGAGNIFFSVFYASNYFYVFCKLNVVVFQKSNDGLNWKLPIGFLLSGCFMSPL